LGTIQGCDGLLAIFIAGHLHEAEAARAPGVAIGHYAYPVHLSERLKKLPQFIFGCVKTEIPDENILHASASALSCRMCKLSSADLAGRKAFLKIDTGAGEQSIAASSIAGFPKCPCQIDFLQTFARLRTLA
jgi:hypothetical protein